MNHATTPPSTHAHTPQTASPPPCPRDGLGIRVQDRAPTLSSRSSSWRTNSAPLGWTGRAVRPPGARARNSLDSCFILAAASPAEEGGGGEPRRGPVAEQERTNVGWGVPKTTRERASCAGRPWVVRSGSCCRCRCCTCGFFGLLGEVGVVGAGDRAVKSAHAEWGHGLLVAAHQVGAGQGQVLARDGGGRRGAPSAALDGAALRGGRGLRDGLRRVQG